MIIWAAASPRALQEPSQAQQSSAVAASQATEGSQGEHSEQALRGGPLRSQSVAAPDELDSGSQARKGAPLLLFRNWDLARLQAACVLAGCDFLPSIKGIGFRKAHALLKRLRLLSRVRCRPTCTPSLTWPRCLGPR